VSLLGLLVPQVGASSESGVNPSPAPIQNPASDIASLRHDDATVVAAAVPNDELYEQYQQNLRQIQAPAAWDVTTGSSSTIIAILDTGIALSHPDLVAKLVPGYDFVNDDAVPDDDNGNGTHVAGVAAASTNNRRGIAGVAWQARLMPVKVLDAAARGDTDRAAQGVIWATDRGANVINLGLAGPTSSPALDDAIAYAVSKGVTIVAPVANIGNAELSYPAAHPQVIAVAAVDRSDRRMTTSNTGGYISVSAPGDFIASTFRSTTGEDGYAVASTTAQAAAHVSGVVALLLSVNPSLTPQQVRMVLETSADDVGTAGRDSETGFGRVNAARAVQMAAPWHLNSQGAGSYVGTGTPSETLFLPLIMKDANGWSTSFTVLNTSRTSSSLTVSLFDEQGRTAHTFPTSLPGQGATTFDPAQIAGIPTGFVGGAVISSTTPIAGVVNEDRAGRDRLTYEGFNSGTRTIQIPLLMRAASGWSTGLQIQNLGATSSPVRVSFYTRDTDTLLAESNFSLPPLSSRTLYQPADVRIPSGWVGSAVVEGLADQPLAAVVNQVHDSGLGMAYVGIGTPSASTFAPLLFKNSGGWNTGLQVQNAGSSATIVNIAYQRTNASGGRWREQAQVQPGASATFYQPANPDLPDDFVGGAIASSEPVQLLAGIVNEIRYSSNMAMAYDAVTTGEEMVYVPLVYRGFAGWNSGIQVQNTAATRATINVTFVNQQGAPVHTQQGTLDGGASITYYLPSLAGLPNGFIGSAMIWSDGHEPLAAIANHVK
jgi:hypothetical protein